MSPTHSSSEPSSAATASEHPLGPSGVRALKFAVVAMGIMIVLGLLVVIARVIQLAASRPAKPAMAVAAGAPGSVAAPAAGRVALPAGATVRTMAVSGDRLAIHFDVQGGKNVIVVIDTVSGQTVSRLELVPAAP